jgi:hypothetical protein
MVMMQVVQAKTIPCTTTMPVNVSSTILCLHHQSRRWSASVSAERQYPHVAATRKTSASIEPGVCHHHQHRRLDPTKQPLPDVYLRCRPATVSVLPSPRAPHYPSADHTLVTATSPAKKHLLDLAPSRLHRHADLPRTT